MNICVSSVRHLLCRYFSSMLQNRLNLPKWLWCICIRCALRKPIQTFHVRGGLGAACEKHIPPDQRIKKCKLKASHIHLHSSVTMTDWCCCSHGACLQNGLLPLANAASARSGPTRSSQTEPHQRVNRNDQQNGPWVWFRTVKTSGSFCRHTNERRGKCSQWLRRRLPFKKRRKWHAASKTFISVGSDPESLVSRHLNAVSPGRGGLWEINTHSGVSLYPHTIYSAMLDAALHHLQLSHVGFIDSFFVTCDWHRRSPPLTRANTFIWFSGQRSKDWCVVCRGNWEGVLLPEITLCMSKDEQMVFICI